MHCFNRQKPRFESSEEEVQITLDGSGKIDRTGRQLWRFALKRGAVATGNVISVRGRQVRVIESNGLNGYVEIL